nr:MAG TPA: hypothetical protein [Caudoviricetes sp.]
MLAVYSPSPRSRRWILARSRSAAASTRRNAPGVRCLSTVTMRAMSRLVSFMTMPPIFAFNPLYTP